MTSNRLPETTDPPPIPPEQPLPSDCCGGGCQRCVHDLHDEAMARYRQELQAWQERQKASPE